VPRVTLRASSLTVAAAVAVFAAVPVWTATNLGTPPGHPNASVQGSLVNAHGTAVAVGFEEVGTTDKSRKQAFVWQKGKRTALVYQRVADIDPVAIDAAGDVVGTAGNRAVRWRRGVARLLGTFVPQAMSSTGDLVVGWNSGGVAHAFFWHRGILTRLPGLGGSGSYATAVNRSGTVVGSSLLPSGGEHAVVWRRGKPTDLGTLDGLDSTATLISAKGAIYGYAFQGDTLSAALEWKSGGLIDLGSFGAAGARPIAVNAHGDVLLQTETVTITGDQSAAGLLLLRGGKTIPVRVPALGHQRLSGFGLDNQDDVIGSGLTRGFLWRNGHATLLPQGLSPVAVAGGWIIASNGLTDRAVLLRRHH
jgi:probable HAF family extracellular repeat protein